MDDFQPNRAYKARAYNEKSVHRDIINALEFAATMLLVLDSTFTGPSVMTHIVRVGHFEIHLG